MTVQRTSSHDEIVNTYELEPTSFKDIVVRPNANLWYKAIVEELQGLERHKTWTLARVPQGRKVIETKWVFKLKDADTANPRYKARLVAKGYSQIEGLDYNQTFSPVVSATAIRTLFALAASNNMDIIHVDFEAAFLNGTLEEETYVTLPELPRLNRHSSTTSSRNCANSTSPMSNCNWHCGCGRLYTD
jgi:hypothetical protein